MSPEPPDPSRPDGAAVPKPPRILVSVGDLEDPADWDVIVVENDAIDDATALRIARERTGHVGASVPSLDEEDVNRAFFPVDDPDAEGTDAVTSDAFAAPDLPVRRAARPDAPPPMLDDGFGHLPGADDDVLPPGDGLPIDSTEVLEDGHLPPVPAHPWVAADDAAMADQPEAVFDPIGDEVELEADPVVEQAPSASVEPDVPPQRALLDDPDAEFYDIGDDTAVLDEPVAGAAPVAEDAWSLADDGVASRDLLDDPDAEFYDIGPEPAEPLETVPWGVPAEAPVARIGLDLWGSPTDEEDGDPAVRPVDAITAAAAAAAARAASVEELPDEPAEDDHTFDSAFPLGPDDLLSPTVDDGATIEVDALDYANVFGPVAGTRANLLPDLVPVRTRRAESDAAMGLYGDDYDDEVEDGDDEPADEDLDAAAAAGGGDTPRRGRRRELAVLALAGLVVAGIGLANQLISSSDDPNLVSPPNSSSSSSSSSTVNERRRVGEVSESTLPTVPTDSTVPLGETDGQGQTNTTVRRVTTTTKKPAGSSTTTTQAPATTTTTQAPATTTTTQAPATTTTVDTNGL